MYSLFTEKVADHMSFRGFRKNTKEFLITDISSKSHMELQITGLDVYLSDPLAKAVVPCANTGVNKYPASSQQVGSFFFDFWW